MAARKKPRKTNAELELELLRLRKKNRENIEDLKKSEQMVHGLKDKLYSAHRDVMDGAQKGLKLLNAIEAFKAGDTVFQALLSLLKPKRDRYERMVMTPFGPMRGEEELERRAPITDEVWAAFFEDKLAGLRKAFNDIKDSKEYDWRTEFQNFMTNRGARASNGNQQA
jgi:hypothetical protein